MAIVSATGTAGALDVVRRAQQPAFLAGKRHEHERARKALALRGRLPRDLDDRRRARGVVVGAVVDFAGALGRHRQVAAAAHVVVVRADDDGLLRRAPDRCPGSTPTTLRTVRRFLDRCST